MEQTKLNSDQGLMWAFDFTKEDLEANRAGRITERQVNRIVYVDQIIMVGLLVVFLPTLFVVLSMLYTQDFSQIGLGAMLGLEFILLAAVVLRLRWLRKQMQLESPNPMLRMIEGQVFCDITEDTETTYQIECSDQIWAVPKGIYATFKNRAPYRLYYVSHRRKIISAELLPEVYLIEQRKLNPNQPLMQVLDFTEADLEANRQGHLSNGQRMRFTREQTRWKILSYFALAGYLLGLIFIARQDISMGILVWIVASAGLIYARSRMKPVDYYLHTDEIHRLEGVIQVRQRFDSKRHIKYYIRVGEYEFNCKIDVVRAFHSGDCYAIYFLLPGQKWYQQNGCVRSEVRKP